MKNWFNGKSAAMVAGALVSGGACFAEDATIPEMPLDVTGLANGAFNTFGEIIVTVFPYVLALAACFLAMKYVKKLAGGKTGN